MLLENDLIMACDDELCDKREETSSIELTAAQNNPEISLHALTGSHNPRTMRVMEIIGKQWITILVDTGSTHSFLDPAVIKGNNLLLDFKEKAKVRVANGE